MESNLQNFSHRHRENHHATPCLKLMSTRIFKGNLSEDGRFARRVDYSKYTLALEVGNSLAHNYTSLV